MGAKKQPLRMCVGCTEMKPKTELIRVVKDKDGNIMLDKKGKAAGRGAYLCNSHECYNKAVKGKKLEKAFKMSIGADIYEAMERVLLDE